MKIMTNRIGKQKGGINRRVYEMGRYVNTRKGNELIVVGMAEGNDVEVSRNGNVREYRLPSAEWQGCIPGSEGNEVPMHLESIESFRRFVDMTIDGIRQVIEKEKPDICFVQGAYYFPWIFCLAASESLAPIVQMYCGSSQSETFCLNHRQAYLEIENEISRLPKGFIFNSELARMYVSGYLAREFPASRVIYNGFPVECLNIVPPVAGQVRLGWCGRNAAVKNIEYLLRLMPFLPSSRVKVFALTNFDDKHGLLREVGIEMLPQIMPEEMGRFYEQISCIISTSFFEFFPNVVFESIASGRVPIVSKMSGIAEILTDNGLSDLVVDLDDVGAVAGLIKQSNGYLGAVQRLAQVLKDDFSWEKSIEKYFAVFKEII